MRTEEAVAAMPCPICRTGLVLPDRQGVEIDYCPTCLPAELWLDRGELDKIIARNTEDASSAARTTGSRESREPRHYDDDEDHRGYRHKKRKRSLLSDLFG